MSGTLTSTMIRKQYARLVKARNQAATAGDYNFAAQCDSMIDHMFSRGWLRPRRRRAA